MVRENSSVTGKWVSGLADALQKRLERFDSAFALDKKAASSLIVSFCVFS